MAFCETKLFFYDADLNCNKEVTYQDELGACSAVSGCIIEIERLDCWSNANHEEHKDLGFISVFKIADKSSQSVLCKSTYAEHLTKSKDYFGDTYWIVRTRIKKGSYGLEAYNVKDQSIKFVHEAASYPTEFSKNKILVSSSIHMLIIENW